MISGEKIKTERMKRGLSQEELGNMLGVTKVSICGYEKGTRTPTLETFLRILDVLQITPDELLGRITMVVGEQEEPYRFKITSEELELIQKLRQNKELHMKIYQELEK